MRLNFLIEPGKFRNRGVWNVRERTETGYFKPDPVQSFGVWFSSLEASQLRLSGGMQSEQGIEPDRFWLLQSDWMIVFRYLPKLRDLFDQKKSIYLDFKNKKHALLNLTDFNEVGIYHLAQVKRTV